jgi:hypothetical protein
MSHQALLDDGSGSIGVRVVIPGLAVEFVSDPQMEGTTSDGRRRIYCLPPAGEGLVIEERINIPEATADVTANRITLNETDDEDLGQLFNALATTETYLLSTIQVNGTQIPVLSETGFAAGDVVHLGTEAILIASVSSQMLHVQARGHWGTVAQAHYSDDVNVGGGLRVVSSSPTRIRGRRFIVYMYGEGDDPQGDGTEVWRGRVTSEATLTDNAAAYTFNVDGILSVLRNKVGSEMEAGAAPRGAYYHWAAPLQIQIVEDGAPGDSLEFYGFDETQLDFLRRLQARLDLNTVSLDSVYTVIAEGDAWNIMVTVGASTTDVQVFIHSVADATEVTFTRWKDADGDPAPTLVAGASYTIDMINSGGVRGSGARTVPRGFFGIPIENFETLNPFYSDESQQEAFPDNRVYLATPVSADWTAVQIKWATSIAAHGFGDGETVDILSFSTADNWIAPRQVRIAPGAAYNAASLPEIKFGRTIAVGSLADFIQNLTHDAPTFANRLTLPAIWEDDFADMTEIRAVLDSAAGSRRFLRERIFTVFSPTDVDKILSHHARALSCYPCLDATGRITFRRFEVPNPSATTVSALDDEVWSDQLANLAPEEQGTFNVVVVKRGYSALDDKHTLRPLEVHDWRAFSDEQEQHPLEIAMQSTAVAGDASLTEEDAESMGLPLLGYFASPYKVVQGIAVTWQLFSVRCGQAVSITSQYLPSLSTGLRPMTDVVGIVVSRRFALGEPFGLLDIIVSPQNIAGYSPAAYIRTSSISFVSGTTYDVTITTGRYAPDGFAEDEFFIDGDKVRLVQYDSETPTEYTGTIVSVNTSTHVARILFDSLLASPGSSEWWLVGQSYSAITTGQRVYCVIAGNDGTIGSGAARARTFSS